MIYFVNKTIIVFLSEFDLIFIIKFIFCLYRRFIIEMEKQCMWMIKVVIGKVNNEKNYVGFMIELRIEFILFVGKIDNNIT